MDKQYRGKNLVGELTPFNDQLGINLGYSLTLARNAVTAASVLINIRIGATFSAAVPKAINIPKLGWMTDLIVYRDLTWMLTPDDRKKVCTSYALLQNTAVM